MATTTSLLTTNIHNGLVVHEEILPQ